MMTPASVRDTTWLIPEAGSTFRDVDWLQILPLWEADLSDITGLGSRHKVAYSFGGEHI